MKFKVGDQVRIVSAPFGFDGSAEKFIGKTVTLIAVGDGLAIFRFGGDCYTWKLDRFESICNQKILITTDGKETKARLYDGKKVVKEAAAKCSPKDEFDFTTGAEIAFNRLVGKEEKSKNEEPKPYNGKIVCVDGKSTAFTTGKIYNVVNGHVYNNQLEDSFVVYRSLDQINRLHYSKFIELVED